MRMRISTGQQQHKKPTFRQYFFQKSSISKCQKNLDGIRPPSPAATLRQAKTPLNFLTFSSLWYVLSNAHAYWNSLTRFQVYLNLNLCGIFSADTHAYHNGIRFRRLLQLYIYLYSCGTFISKTHAYRKKHVLFSRFFYSTFNSILVVCLHQTRMRANLLHLVLSKGFLSLW